MKGKKSLSEIKKHLGTHKVKKRVVKKKVAKKKTIKKRPLNKRGKKKKIAK